MKIIQVWILQQNKIYQIMIVMTYIQIEYIVTYKQRIYKVVHYKQLKIANILIMRKNMKQKKNMKKIIQNLTKKRKKMKMKTKKKQNNHCMNK